MRSLGTRRAGLVAGAATVAVLALAGCSAGQVAETAMLDTPIAGVDSQTSDGSVLVRNLQIPYPGLEGYAAGSNAPVELSLYNQTNDTISVTISSRPLERGQVVSAKQVGLVGSAPSAPAGTAGPEPVGSRSAATPDSQATDEGNLPSQEAAPGQSAGSSPSPSPEPVVSSAPAVGIEPAKVELGPQGSVLFRPSDTASQLQAVGLSEELLPGMAVNLVLEFSNGARPLELQAPVAIPLTPASRGPGVLHPEEAPGEVEQGTGEGH